jgi:hypothetical protein
MTGPTFLITVYPGLHFKKFIRNEVLGRRGGPEDSACVSKGNLFKYLGCSPI